MPNLFIALRKLSLVLGLLFIVKSTFAVTHQIKIRVTGISNQKVLLAHYFANKTKHAVDTTLLDQRGNGVFKNSRKLDPGIYLIILPDYSNFEFLLDTNQTFQIEIFKSTRPYSARFTNSQENIGYRLFCTRKQKYDSLLSISRAKERSSDVSTTFEKHQKESLRLRSAFNDFKVDMMKKYPGSFLEQLIGSKISETDDPFDTLDISIFRNPSLLNTPYFERSLLYYLDNIIPSNNYTKKIKLSELFNNAFAFPILYQYLSSFLVKHYLQQPHQEELFVYVADNYFLPFATWATPEEMEAIYNESEALKLNMVGKQAPNFYFYDMPLDTGASVNTGSKTTIYQVPGDFIVLLFTDTDCASYEKLEETIFDLSKQYRSQKVSFFSLNHNRCNRGFMLWNTLKIQNSMSYNILGLSSGPEYKSLYQIKESPTIYILDKNKTIIARKIKWEEIQHYLPPTDAK